MKEKTRKTIDRIVWDAHFKKDFQAIDLISSKDWKEYWLATRKDCRGYWHGATGLIAERLNIGSKEWRQMIRFHQPEPPACIGDSSHDYSYLVEAARQKILERLEL